MATALTYLLNNEPLFTPSRLPSLYSDLNLQRTTNPEGFAANVTAWSAALSGLLASAQLPGHSCLSIQLNDVLLDTLRSQKYGRPTGLGCVVDGRIKEGGWIEKGVFLGAQEGIYERGKWRVPGVGEVVRWGLRRLGVLGEGGWDDDGRLKRGEIVVVAALEVVAGKVIKWREEADTGLMGRVWAREEFIREVSKAVGLEGKMDDKDVDVLLTYLQRDRNVLIYNATTIKFRPTNTTTPEPITEEDTAIANLKLTIDNLNTQIMTLEKHITTLQLKAANAVKAKQKHTAMSALRSKTLALRQLEQRQATLQQLEEVGVQIENAAGQVEIISTLQQSAGVLKTLNKKVGDVDKVDDVMAQLREEMEKTSEVQGVLGEELAGNVGAETEVDEEFERMEKAEVEAREREKVESTRRRLEETAAVPVSIEQGRQGVKEMDVDEQLAKSVEKLEGLKLSERDSMTRNEVPAQ